MLTSQNTKVWSTLSPQSLENISNFQGWDLNLVRYKKIKWIFLDYFLVNMVKVLVYLLHQLPTSLWP